MISFCCCFFNYYIIYSIKNEKEDFMNKLSKILVIFLSLAFIVSNSVITGFSIEKVSKTNNTLCYTGYIPDEYERITEVSDMEHNEINLRYPSVPSNYDPRLCNYETPEKFQGSTNLCWMFSTTAAVEQYLSKYYGEKVALSEAHGARALSEDIIPANFIDESGYYTNELNEFGNAPKALQYFSNWNAPIDMLNWSSSVTDTSYPFSKINDNIGDDFYEKESFSNITSTKYVSTNDRLQIKDAIYNYGGVTIAIPGLLEYTVDEYGDKAASVVSNNEIIDHMVLLVGWDDNYPKENFLNQPSSDGAWLVKNSGGTGYCWYSYYSTLQSNSYGAVITGAKKADPNEKMLSYDFLIPNHKATKYDSGVYLCNVFDVSNYTETYDKITKVMTYFTMTNNCEYQVRIIQLNSNGDLPTNNIDDYNVLASGTYSGEGYVTIDLDTPFYFSNDNKCAIIIKLIPTANNSKIYIPYEDRLYVNNIFTGQYLNSIPKINVNESFFALPNNNGSIIWNDCYSNSDYGVNGRKGNLIIRPVLYKETIQDNPVTISPDKISDNDNDIAINISSPNKLFNIHTANNQVLRQDIDYLRSNNGIIIKNSFIKSLNGAYEQLVLEFIGSLSKVIEVNSNSDITDITIIGKPIVGETLSAYVIGYPERSLYDLNYQWEYSFDGLTWSNIVGATENYYVIDDNFFDCYFRITATPKPSGNVNTGNVSNSTVEKSVFLGDVNLDSFVTVGDATLVQLYILKLQSLTNRQLIAADYNKDGIVDWTDSTLIQQKAAELLRMEETI